MADIELVIKIPEEKYNYIKKQVAEGIDNSLKVCIANGTPLPEHHGRLMILSEDKLKENQINLDSSCQKWISEVGISNSVVTIIPATKEKQSRNLTVLAVGNGRLQVREFFKQTATKEGDGE